MEQTTLQQCIEERAAKRLLEDLYSACEKQNEIIAIIGQENFPKTLRVSKTYNSYNHKTQIELKDTKAEEIYKSLLPKYITMVTDEVLHKIDEIDYVLSEKANEPADY